MQKIGSLRPRNYQSQRRAGTPPRVLRELIAPAGVRFNGDAPWDIQVHDEDMYRRILAHGSLGFGESYMDGQWDCQQLDELFYRLLDFHVENKLVGRARIRLLAAAIHWRLFNLQNIRRAFQVGERHYDIGNDIFIAMLDPTMSYSCGYWHNADTLVEAQHNKLELICRKLELKRGERLLDIGCGWGGLAEHAARRYGVEVTGITVSRKQMELARERCEGLPVRIELMDYREIDGQYDKLASVGMFEHVGTKNYPVYFQAAKRLMKDDGLFLLQTIGVDSTTLNSDPWIHRYIFPNGKLPPAEEITGAISGQLLIEDWHNFGPDYDRTLMAWWERFDSAWPELEPGYGNRFYRMWKYYLMSCAGFFRSRRGQLWQVVLSKRAKKSLYRSVR